MLSLSAKRDCLCPRCRGHLDSLELSVEGQFKVESMKYLKAVWEFCSYVFVPQRRPKET